MSFGCRVCWFISFFLPVSLTAAAGAVPAWNAPPSEQTEGRFWRVHWYERGLTNANPAYEIRFRVNSPEVVLDPRFGGRVEARENGLMLIKAEENLFRLAAAEFYCEAWGGHPGTANKRVTVNGRGAYYLPRVGTEQGHCTYFYPFAPLKLTDLVNGYDAIQFAVDQGTTFWGHMLVDNAAVLVALTNTHPDLGRLGPADFAAAVKTEESPDAEGFRLTLAGPANAATEIARVDFHGWYHGYDENGNLHELDWHGFTKNRLPMAHLGTATSPPFTVVWNTSMLPAQTDVAVRAVVRFKAATNLWFLTAARGGLQISARAGLTVQLLAPRDLPTPFWSRDNQKKTCSLDLDVDPARIERAELHIIAWTGGAGGVKDYFKLSGVPYAVAEGERHELIYSRLPVNPQALKRGRNPIELLSDTKHHGIEIIHPGPALMVRYRTEAASR